jgi:HPt (histidine-containing phosphotransfer) domain-containing protein
MSKGNANDGERMKSPAHTASKSMTSLGAVLDVADALDRLGNDEELLREIIQIYAEDSPHMLEQIHAAAANGDARALQRAAHSLKGLAATLSAQDVVGSAARLEHMGAVCNLADASTVVGEGDQRATRLDDAVQEFLHGK